MDQIFCLAPSMSPPMLPVVSSANTTSTCGLGVGAVGKLRTGSTCCGGARGASPVMVCAGLRLGAAAANALAMTISAAAARIPFVVRELRSILPPCLYQRMEGARGSDLEDRDG